MRIANLADLHLREVDAHMDLGEQTEMHRLITCEAAARGARLCLISGDVYDATSTPLERLAAISIVREWASLMPVVIVRGNHDRKHDLEALRTVGAAHPVAVLSSPAAFSVPGARVLCLPWPFRELLAAQIGPSALAQREALAQGLRSILAMLRDEAQGHMLPVIFVGHVELGGARLDSGQPVAARCDVLISEGDLLDVGADYYALGHIHGHQVLGDRICYPGSPRQLSFGEEGPKGWCLVDVEPGAPPVIQHIEAAGRRLVTRHGLASPVRGEVTGASVRVVYDVPEGERETVAQLADETRAQLLSDGAHSVKLDPRVQISHRVRSAAIAEARTTADRVEALWTARGTRPDRAPELLAKLQTLDQEVQP